jgi:hypothetical protein
LRASFRLGFVAAMVVGIVALLMWRLDATWGAETAFPNRGAGLRTARGTLARQGVGAGARQAAHAPQGQE